VDPLARRASSGAAGPAAARRGVTAFVALLAIGFTLAPTAVIAHATLVRSSPARGATLLRRPDRVQLWFNERLEPGFVQLSVWNGSGTRVDRGDATVRTDDPKLLWVTLPPLPPAAYLVRYRVLSVDGHVVEGEFSFVVRPQ
jgi:methionine-rich copper-binding protein CopC